MNCYTYFPGCSSSPEGGASAYGRSIQAVSQALGFELRELDDWNCCGSTPSSSVDEIGAFCLAARNLALAEKIGLDMVTPCSACYVIFNHTNSCLKLYPHLKIKVDQALSAGGLVYNRTIRVRHILDVIVSDIGYEVIRAHTKKPLNGTKIAPYYGCQTVRPNFGFDHPETPESLDRLIAAVSGEATFFPRKSHCCGGSLIISAEESALELTHSILESAYVNGAECIITACPLCQTNLDAYQNRVNKKYKTNYKLPILFFTQVLGIAFGLDEKALGLKKSIVSPEKLLTKIGQGATYES